MKIQIDSLSTIPIYQQLRDQIVLGIASGQVALAAPLPSVRKLAGQLGINYHTVSKAYSILSEEGYIAIDRGKGAIVTPSLKRDKEYNNVLAQKLSLIAAEALCHLVSEDEFVELCGKYYKRVIGK